MSKFREILRDSSDAFLPRKVRNFLGKDIIGTKDNTFYVSGWSVFHLIMGILVGYLVIKYLVENNSTKLVDNYYYKMLIVHTTWEFWQNFIGDNDFFRLKGRGNLIDTLMDTMFFMLGAIIARKLF